MAIVIVKEKLSEKERANLFLDLKRAATSFYLNPKGKTWEIFLDHALKILKGKRKFHEFTTEIENIKERASRAEKKEIINLADEM